MSGPGPTLLAVREVLREAERPLAVKELVPLVQARMSETTKNLERSVRNALQNDQACVSDGDGRWVYLPSHVRGAAMRTPVRYAAPETGELVVASELITLLWPPVGSGKRSRAARIKLEDGPTVRVSWSNKNPTRLGDVESVVTILKLPDPFWSWWGRQQAEGANTLVVRCEDGEAGRYSGQAVELPLPTLEETEEAHRSLLTAAERAMRRSPGAVTLADLAGRLIARGLYHEADPTNLPPSFMPGLMLPLGRFVLAHGGFFEIGHFTPGLANLLARRLLLFWIMDEEEAREALGLPILPRPFLAGSPSAEPAEPVVAGVRYTVRLLGSADVWRTLELRDDQTLEDLHDAIQDAFGWDDRHLYAYFMSGAAWDQLTEIARPTGPEDLPPTADVARLRDLGLEPGSHFLYVYDFGEEHRHLVTFEETFPLDEGAQGAGYPLGAAEGAQDERRFPRVVAGEGEVEADGFWDDLEDDNEDEEDGEWPTLDDLDALIDEGVALGLIPPSGAALPAIEAGDLASLGVPTLRRFSFPPSDPKLRRLPVDLDELASAFVEEPGTIEFRLDVETGELLWLHGKEDDAEERALRARIAADPLRYPRLPLEGNAELRRDAEVFMQSIADEGLQDRLRRALESTRPRRRFFDALARHPAEQRHWLDFHDRRLADRVIAWLASVGVAPDLSRPW
jgi:hypothetical protein